MIALDVYIRNTWKVPNQKEKKSKINLKKVERKKI